MAVSLDPKNISFIKIFKTVNLKKLELMYQKISVGNTTYFYFSNEIKEDIFVVLCQLHNIISRKYTYF